MYNEDYYEPGGLPQVRRNRGDPLVGRTAGDRKGNSRSPDKHAMQYSYDIEETNFASQVRKPKGHVGAHSSPRREINRLKHKDPLRDAYVSNNGMQERGRKKLSPVKGGKGGRSSNEAPSPLRRAHVKNIELENMVDDLTAENNNYKVTLAAWKLRYYVEYLRLSGTNRYTADIEADLESKEKETQELNHQLQNIASQYEERVALLTDQYEERVRLLKADVQKGEEQLAEEEKHRKEAQNTVTIYQELVLELKGTNALVNEKLDSCEKERDSQQERSEASESALERTVEELGAARTEMEEVTKAKDFEIAAAKYKQEVTENTVRELSTKVADLEIHTYAAEQKMALAEEEQSNAEGKITELKATLEAHEAFLGEKRSLDERLKAAEAELTLRMIERMKQEEDAQLESLRYRMQEKEKLQLEQVTRRVANIAPAHVSSRIHKGEAALATQEIFQGAFVQHSVHDRMAQQIQNACRRKVAYKVAAGLRKFRDAAISVQNLVRKKRAFRRVVALRMEHEAQKKQRKAAILIQSRSRGLKSKQVSQKRKKEVEHERLAHKSALVIQAHIRRLAAVKRVCDKRGLWMDISPHHYHCIYTKCFMRKI